MASKQVALELAAFLDSEPARGLRGPSREEVKRIAEAFLGVCYEELGKAPRFLDGEDVREVLSRRLPAHLRRADPLAEHVPDVLAAFLDHLESASVVTQAFEIRRALEAGLPAFREEVASGRSALRSVQREKPFVHGASKLGRNDPCSCGSGKKYKKCHGREG